MLHPHAAIARSPSLLTAGSIVLKGAQRRHASLNSSIGRGIRRSRAANGRNGKGSYRSQDRGKQNSRTSRDLSPFDEANDGSHHESTSKNRLQQDYGDEKRRSQSHAFGTQYRTLGTDEGQGRFSIPRLGKDVAPRMKWSDTPHDLRSGPRPFARSLELDESKDRNSKHGPSDTPVQRRIEQIRQELERLENRVRQPQRSKSREIEERPVFSSHDPTDVYYPLANVKRVAPRHIVYTKPGTEFIYGSSAVLAALRCARRKLHKLYIYQPDGAFSYNDGIERRASILKAIQKLGLKHNAQVFDVSGNWLPYLSKLADDRPHNGVVLEASPLPQPPIVALRRHDDPAQPQFGVKLAPQQSDEAEVNGTCETIDRFFHTHDTTVFGASGRMERYPMVVVLDKIKDPGNLGAIIRSAYYFGVDAVIVSRNCPGITPVVLKASAGAAENLPIFRITNVQTFLQESRKNGWRFYAADAPESSDYQGAQDAELSMPCQPSSVSRKLCETPCGLVMGSEDKGLDNKVLKEVDDRVSIISALTRSAAEDSASVDSLNVSVAAALLLQSFLGDATIVQRARPFGPPMTVPEMVNVKMKEEEPHLNDMFRRLVQSG